MEAGGRTAKDACAELPDKSFAEARGRRLAPLCRVQMKSCQQVCQLKSATTLIEERPFCAPFFTAIPQNGRQTPDATFHPKKNKPKRRQKQQKKLGNLQRLIRLRRANPASGLIWANLMLLSIFREFCFRIALNGASVAACSSPPELDPAATLGRS